LPTDLPIKLGRVARRSTDAGDYVCNYSMYVMLDRIRRGRRGIRYGFVHVPFDRDARAVAALIGRAVQKWLRSKMG